jgi:hypothetical protein
MSSTGYKRVYIRGGAYYYVDLERKYHWLSRISDGKPAMLRALGKFTATLTLPRKASNS